MKKHKWKKYEKKAVKYIFELVWLHGFKNLFDHAKGKRQPLHMKQHHAIQIEVSQYKIDPLLWILELESTCAYNIQAFTILDCATSLLKLTNA